MSLLLINLVLNPAHFEAGHFLNQEKSPRFDALPHAISIIVAWKANRHVLLERFHFQILTSIGFSFLFSAVFDLLRRKPIVFSYF